MFTGLVEARGIVRGILGDDPRRLVVQTPFEHEEIDMGASIAVDGCCLTVVEKELESLHFEVGTETLKRTSLNRLKLGDTVNLERSLRVGDRMGGHFVTGHVDALGELCSIKGEGGMQYTGVSLPKEYLRLVAAQGSVTLSGVSLTVTSVDDHAFYVGLIPHTLEATTLGSWRVGTKVNVEVDILARYVARIALSQSFSSEPLSEASLKMRGFL